MFGDDDGKRVGFGRRPEPEETPRTPSPQPPPQPRSDGTSRSILALAIFGIIPLVFVLVGTWMLMGTIDFMNAALPTTGEVVRVIERHDDDGTTYTAVFRYTDERGAAQEGRTHISSSGYDFARGERVAILYDPASPGTIRVDGWFSIWGFPAIFLLIGLLFEAGFGIALIARIRGR